MAALPRLADSSPTATLLRNSRLFSLPQPLPRPNIAKQLNERIWDSDTATTPYPTHQIIATTDASRARGDWGLKRPLPSKSTSTLRGIRMHALDTSDVVTDFESARDHMMTLKKLQELNITMQRYPRVTSEAHMRNGKFPTASAFETVHDRTFPEALASEEAFAQKSGKSAGLSARWKYRGPELKAMSQAEFNKFVERGLTGRKVEFERFLKTYLVKEYLRPLADAIYDDTIWAPNLVKELIIWLDRLSLPALESYLAIRSRSLKASQSIQAWITDAKLEQTPAWMPPRPSTPPTFEDHAWNGLLAHRIIDGHRLRRDQGHAATKTGIDDVDSQIGALDLQNSRTFEQAPENSEYTQEERDHVSNILQQAELKIFGDIESKVLPNWSAWLIDFRNTSGRTPIHRHLIEYFLDLPRTVVTTDDDTSSFSTHPSAGLSYRRTYRNVNNHPVYGPLVGGQAYRLRRLAGAQALRTVDSYLTNGSGYGLGGVAVVNDARRAYDDDLRIASSSDKFDEDGNATAPLRGTPKSWAVISRSSITGDGRIHMTVTKPVDAIEMVVERKVEDATREDEEAAKDPLGKVPKVARATPFDLGSSTLVRDGRLVDTLDKDSS